jgi:hypothetical protein
MSGKDKYPSYAQAPIAAASFRAPMRTEILPLAVSGSASKRYVVPDTWKGLLVRFQADGGDVYVQVSTAADATCDIAARAVETGTPIAITAPLTVNGCFKISDGQWLDIPFGADASTFATIGSVDCCARTHPAET